MYNDTGCKLDVGKGYDITCITDYFSSCNQVIQPRAAYLNACRSTFHDDRSLAIVYFDLARIRHLNCKVRPDKQMRASRKREHITSLLTEIPSMSHLVTCIAFGPVEAVTLPGAYIGSVVVEPLAALRLSHDVLVSLSNPSIDSPNCGL